MEFFLKNLKEFSKKYPNKNPEVLQQYGTAGFRNKADQLQHITFRTGILAALRSFNTQSIIGVMITASHNPAEDNGLKIIESDGTMLEQSWESLATKIANVSDDNLEQCIVDMMNELNLSLNSPDMKKAKVLIAYDTRKSSPSLCQVLIDGIKVFGDQSQFENFELLTTPQLHFIVKCINCINGEYGEPTEQGYYKKLSDAFINLLAKHDGKKLYLTLDCANGVGAPIMKRMSAYLQDKITFDLLNIGDGILNHNCGADFVKVNQKQPPMIRLELGKHYASFDGDADRIVFYYLNEIDGRFHLLDGDKIAVLVAKYLKKLLIDSQMTDTQVIVVQTAYANGNSTKYITEALKLQTDCVPTGVKHLHHRASQSDVGIYFEANGHGTVLFSDQTQKRIADCSLTNENAKKLLHFIDLVNQTVGDAISDMLIVEAILADMNLTIAEWDSFYEDLPNKLLKVSVKNRLVIETTDAERRCLRPKGLQEAIDAVIQSEEFKDAQARSFIRPSGTEDVVRIYAEAKTKQLADELARKVGNLVYDYADGIGPRF